MNDNDRRRVNELYKKIVREHDPDYCDPETLPMTALCALIHDEVVEKDLRLNSYNAEMCIKERELRELKEKFDNYRLAVKSLLRVPPAARREYEDSRIALSSAKESLDGFNKEITLSDICKGEEKKE